MESLEHLWLIHGREEGEFPQLVTLDVVDEEVGGVHAHSKKDLDVQLLVLILKVLDGYDYLVTRLLWMDDKGATCEDGI